MLIGALAYSDQIRQQLAPHLPEGVEATPQAMADLLRSPQFAQATQNLTQMMASGGIGVKIHKASLLFLIR